MSIFCFYFQVELFVSLSIHFNLLKQGKSPDEVGGAENPIPRSRSPGVGYSLCIWVVNLLPDINQNLDCFVSTSLYCFVFMIGIWEVIRCCKGHCFLFKFLYRYFAEKKCYHIYFVFINLSYLCHFSFILLCRWSYWSRVRALMRWTGQRNPPLGVLPPRPQAVGTKAAKTPSTHSKSK